MPFSFDSDVYRTARHSFARLQRSYPDRFDMPFPVFLDKVSDSTLNLGIMYEEEGICHIVEKNNGKWEKIPDLLTVNPRQPIPTELFLEDIMHIEKWALEQKLNPYTAAKYVYAVKEQSNDQNAATYAEQTVQRLMDYSKKNKIERPEPLFYSTSRIEITL